MFSEPLRSLDTKVRKNIQRFLCFLLMSAFPISVSGNTGPLALRQTSLPSKVIPFVHSTYSSISHNVHFFNTGKSRMYFV